MCTIECLTTQIIKRKGYTQMKVINISKNLSITFLLCNIKHYDKFIRIDRDEFFGSGTNINIFIPKYYK